MTSTVPCVAQTRRPSFSTSMRTTAVFVVNEMTRAVGVERALR